MVKTIANLFAHIPFPKIQGDQKAAFKAVTADSREANEETLFVAVKGTGGDGHSYLAKALANGCKAVVYQESLDKFLSDDQLNSLNCSVKVADTRPMPALLARELNNCPDRKLRTAAVTGTNGKTTVSYLMREMLNQLDGPCGLVGTICYDDGKESVPAPLTTPGGPVFYHWLNRMAVHGCRSVAMELSSHALDQQRTAGLELAVAVMTNIGRDHLDYHHDVATYVQAKASIFSLLKPGAMAVINVADRYLSVLDTADHPVLSFDPRPSLRNKHSADLILVKADLQLAGTHLEFDFKGEKLVLSSPLVGRFNVENLMASFCAGVALGFSEEDVCQALAGVKQVPGRLERIILPNGGIAVVDYAHTHDALEAVLKACDEISSGKILVALGCGGDRDVGKRPLMGEVAAKMADGVWITSDNPRTEDPSAICMDIAKGYHSVVSARSNQMSIIEDRSQAIWAALAQVENGDIIVVAGKGHEDYQLVGDRILDLDDRQIIRDWIEEQTRGH